VILKPREDSRAAIDALESLLHHPAANSHDRHQILRQIDAIRAGDMGESSAAYYADVFFGASKNWAVIHDLRVEHQGFVAQIDHILIGRLFDVWVLESKRFRNGIKIDERGECITWSGRRPIAVESPIEQNRRHVRILQDLLDAGRIPLPRRLGLPIKPKLRSLVLIAEGRISRPNAPVPGIETVIKTDQLRNTVIQHGDTGNPLDLMKLVGPDTLESFARALVDLHSPITRDWERQFRLANRTPPATKPLKTADPVPVVPPPAASIEKAPSRKSAGSCATCAAPLSAGVARFCKANEDRFGGQLLCMTCQPKALRRAG
jgi:hypothetical protein